MIGLILQIVIFLMIFCNKFGECCTVDFPVHMLSYVKFFPVRYNKINDSVVPCICRDFNEIVSVVKKYY